MRKVKKNNVGTFTILSKHPKGQKRNVIYDVTYQRTGNPEIYQVKMIWLDFREEHTWAFMDGREADRLSLEEREEFIKEMPKFQKGGSYRKTHPITYSEKGKLLNQIKQKEYEIYQLKEQIEKMDSENLNKLCNEYKKCIDTSKILKFENSLKALEVETGYSLRKKNLRYNTSISVIDSQTNIPVGEIIQNRNDWHIEPFDDFDIKSIIKDNSDIEDFLKGRN